MKLIPIMFAFAAVAVVPAVEQGDSSGGGQSISSEGSGQQHSQEALQTLPEQGRQAVLKDAMQHDARVTGADREQNNGVTYYEVDLQNQDGEFTLFVSEQGRIVSIQHPRLAWHQVPEPVRQAIEQEAQQGEMITEIIRTRREGQQVYKAELEKDGKGRDLVLSPEGRQLPAHKHQ